jgi:ABC-type nitrate/sulfonate/bicarbonate transport system substrate-binding protein
MKSYRMKAHALRGIACKPLDYRCLAVIAGFGIENANILGMRKETFTQRPIASRLRYILLLALPILLLLSSCGKSGNQSTQQVRMAYQPIVFGLPVFVGNEQKIFEKHNLAVEAKSFTSANDMMNALVARQVDMVPGAPLVPVLALEAQYPGRFRVMSHSIMTTDKPFDRILVKSESPIKSPKDLGGKKLALIPGTTASNVVRAFLKQQGVDPQTVSFIQLAPTAQLPALQSGSVDALYAYEPLVTIALTQGDSFRAITGSIYTSLLEPCPLVVLIVDRNFEREHPETVKRAAEAFDEIFKVMREDPAKANAALVPYLKIPADIAPKVNLQNMTYSGQMQLDNLQRFIDILREIGEIQNPIDAKQLTAETK